MSPLSQFIDTVLSTDRKYRVRLRRWASTVLVYSCNVVLLVIGVHFGLVDGWALLGLVSLVSLGLVGFYTALRTGWSERFADKALTQPQIVFAILSVFYAYLICGAVRSAPLFTLLFVFMFGAFSLDWRRMAALAGFTVTGLAATIFILHLWQPSLHDARLDIANLIALAVLMPACSWIAADLSALRSRLRRQRGELTSALTEVERLATRDELTGLINRRRMNEVLSAEVLRSVRKDQPFCVAMIDLDHFKRVNDVYGHATGDSVLRGFTQEALLAIRASDTLARWGGEEFLLVMPETGAEAARLVLERMRERLAAHSFETGRDTLKMTLSAGVTENVVGEDLTTTIARADSAVYIAKAQGRNTVALV